MSVFEMLRERVDLAELAGRFTELKQSGRALCGRCLFLDHPDHTPSFYVYPDERFHCFGCRRHGDVTDLWAGVRGIEPGIEAALDLAREYSLEPPEVNPAAWQKARELRELEERYMRQAAACHEALLEHESVAEWWEGRGFDKELQERFLLGANKDGTMAVIPFWNRGRSQGLIRRRLSGEPKYLYPKAEELPAGHRPLFIPGPVRGGAFLVEGIIDARAGSDTVNALGGTTPFPAA